MYSKPARRIPRLLRKFRTNNLLSTATKNAEEVIYQYLVFDPRLIGFNSFLSYSMIRLILNIHAVNDI